MTPEKVYSQYFQVPLISGFTHSSQRSPRMVSLPLFPSRILDHYLTLVIMKASI